MGNYIQQRSKAMQETGDMGTGTVTPWHCSFYQMFLKQESTVHLLGTVFSGRCGEMGVFTAAGRSMWDCLKMKP